MTDQTQSAHRASAVMRRTLDAAVRIGSADPEGIDFQHAVLCQVGIPRSRTSGKVFERHSGFVSVRLEAGALFDGEGFVEQPLPYGTRPRLTLVYASGYALRHKTREIDLGSSLREFMRRLGLDDSGGERGNYRAMREQTVVEFEAYSPHTGRWLEVRVYPSERGLSVFSRDIEARRQAADEHRYLASLLDNVEDGVIATDAEDFRVTAWNEGAERIYGFSAEEVLGRPAREVGSYPGDESRLKLETRPAERR